MRNPTVPSSLALAFLLSAALLAGPVSGEAPVSNSVDSQLAAAATTVPALPVMQSSPNQTSCQLDLSDELFGGVQEACGTTLDRSRCCPVLAAWLFAAHARSALEVRPPPVEPAGVGPAMPDDSQRCVDTLQGSLKARGIDLPRPNATCDVVLCFCGIRLHQIGSLSCPAAFNVSSASRNATPMAAVRELERTCRNASYAGCTRCLRSLGKVKGGSGDRASRMFGRDCQLMGLTWLLERNKTVYIPTVSAVLRAVMYSENPPEQPHRCSPDQENMPLAVNTLQFQRDVVSSSADVAAPVNSIYSVHVLLLVFLAAQVLFFLRGA